MLPRIHPCKSELSKAPYMSYLMQVHRSFSRPVWKEASDKHLSVMSYQYNGISQAEHFTDTDALLAALPGLLHPGDSVLIKASHGMGYAKIVEALEK